MSTLDDVVLIEILSTDVQGPERATRFSAELCSVASQDSTQPILLDMRRCTYLSSMGYSALFKLVKQAKEHGTACQVLQHAPGREGRGRHRGSVSRRRDLRLPGVGPGGIRRGLSRLSRPTWSQALPGSRTVSSFADRDLARGCWPAPPSRLADDLFEIVLFAGPVRSWPFLVTVIKPMHISSVVAGPQVTSLGGLLGLWGLFDELS